MYIVSHFKDEDEVIFIWQKEVFEIFFVVFTEILSDKPKSIKEALKWLLIISRPYDILQNILIDQHGFIKIL